MMDMQAIRELHCFEQLVCSIILFCTLFEEDCLVGEIRPLVNILHICMLNTAKMEPCDSKLLFKGYETADLEIVIDVEICVKI